MITYIRLTYRTFQCLRAMLMSSAILISSFFMEQCKYCNGPQFTDPKIKARHYLVRQLKLLSTNQDNLLIRRTGNRFIEFSIDFNHKEEGS